MKLILKLWVSNMNIKKKIVKEIILVLFILCLIASLIIFFSNRNGKIANIYKEDKLIESINLDEVKEDYEFVIEDDNGNYNKVLVSKGNISIIEASCPDSVCINTGKISNGFLPIICLPNKVTIEIVNGDKGDLDGKSF